MDSKAKFVFFAVFVYEATIKLFHKDFTFDI